MLSSVKCSCRQAVSANLCEFWNDGYSRFDSSGLFIDIVLVAKMLSSWIEIGKAGVAFDDMRLLENISRHGYQI